MKKPLEKPKLSIIQSIFPYWGVQVYSDLKSSKHTQGFGIFENRASMFKGICNVVMVEMIKRAEIQFAQMTFWRRLVGVQ